jgi:NADPH2:quinone reductase
MKAIRVHQFGEPQVMSLEEVPEPTLLAGHVLVEIRAVGVNPVDTYIRSGKYPVLPNPPYTPGTDAAGLLRAIGDGVQGLALGSRVYIGGSVSGTYAEFALCHREQVRPLPDNIEFEGGAGLYVPYFTAFRALFQVGEAKPGETVLIHGGSGSVGLACIQFARDAGLRVIATAGTEKGLRLIVRMGADHALNHTKPGYMDEITSFTAGKEPNLIVEMLANVNLGQDLKHLAPAGRVVVVGSRGDVSITPRDLMAREASVRGVQLAKMSASDAAEAEAAIAKGLASGQLKPQIAARFSLSEASQAHREVLGAGSAGKIVLLP